MKKYLINILIALLATSLLLVAGCSQEADKKPTTGGSTGPVEVEISDTFIDPVLQGWWDSYEIVLDPTRYVDLFDSSTQRDYPQLTHESYLYLSDKTIKIQDADLAPDADDLVFADNQVFSIKDGVRSYKYDYFYNKDNGILWMKADTSAVKNWAYDPIATKPDSLTVPAVTDGYVMLYPAAVPPVVTLLEPLNDYQTDTMQPVLDWNDYEDAEKYIVQVRTNDGNFDDPVGMVFVDTVTVSTVEFEDLDIELPNFQPYWWRVKADNSSWSEIGTFQTYYIVILDSPVDNQGACYIPNLIWNEYKGATTYELQLGRDSSFETSLIDLTDLTETEYTITSLLQPNVRYYWRVRSDNSGGFWSSVQSFETDLRPYLNRPNNMVNDLGSLVNFDWDDVDNNTEFTLEVTVDSTFATVDYTIQTEESQYQLQVLPNTHYFWRVSSPICYNISNQRSFTTNMGPILKSPFSGSTQIEILPSLHWVKYNNSGDYDLQVATDAEFNGIVFEHIDFDKDFFTAEADDIYYTPAFVFSPLTQYWWRVKSHRGDNWSEAWNFTTSDIYTQTILKTPADQAIGVDVNPELNWERITGVDHYLLQVNTEPDFTNPMVNKTLTGTSYTFKDKQPFSATYYWRVIADNGEWSEVRSFTIESGLPANFNVVSVSPYKVDIAWTGTASKTDGYKLYRSNELNGEYEEYASLRSNAVRFVDLGLEEGSEWYYKVEAYNRVGSAYYYSSATEPVAVTVSDYAGLPDFEMVDVPAGSFTMGSELETAQEDEKPAHTVTLTHDFAMSKYEITNAQYVNILNWALGRGYIRKDDIPALANSNGIETSALKISLLMHWNWDDGDIEYDDAAFKFVAVNNSANKPVRDLRWRGAAVFCQWINEIAGYENPYTNVALGTATVEPYGANGYRLPTEAEWEYAARYNDGRIYPWGGTEPQQENGNYFNSGWGDASIEVGSCSNGANVLGIQDLAGNVWEWCNDVYDANYYSAGNIVDPVGVGGAIGFNTQVVIRGGSYEFGGQYTRTSNRSVSESNQADTSNYIKTACGIRLVKPAN